MFSASAQLIMLPVLSPPSFELMCVRVVVGSHSEIAVAIYRPGFQPIQQQFFDDLSSVLDSLAVYAAPVHVFGDFNVRLDRRDDQHAIQLRSMMTSYGLLLSNTDPTHVRGGTLDAVASVCCGNVSVVDVGLSDHHALVFQSTSSSSSSHPALAADSPMVRPWRRLDVNEFRSSVSESRLCAPESWPDDLDELCSLYDVELSSIINRLLPLCRPPARRRPSDPWFDAECRASKRLTRNLERAYCATCRRACSQWSMSRVAEVAAAKAAWYTQRRLYRQLRQRKCSDFWRKKVDSTSSNPRQLWDAIDRLLGRGKSPSNPLISVDQFSAFFNDKVDKIRQSTINSAPATFTDLPDDVRFSDFANISVDNVITAIRRLPNKSSAADPIPTSVLQQVSDIISPFITELFNRSLCTGQFPGAFKSAFIAPIVKKVGLNSADVGSYRPISNLPVLSKLFERLVAKQLLTYLQTHSLLPQLQSGFRSGHSSETAMLHVLSDILEAVDRGEVAALALLDLSAAFDTVDHAILLERLRRSFGLTDVVLRWFGSYLSGRSQSVRCGSSSSPAVDVICGVPQGSVLGPILFIMYTVDLPSIIQRHHLTPHLYADDTQVYGFCSPPDVDQLLERLHACLDEVASWMDSNRLQLNANKTNFIWCHSARRHCNVGSLIVNGSVISPSASVRDLGVIVDADLSMRSFVHHLVSCCFASLRRLRTVRRHVSAPVIQTMLTSLVLSRLDYCNSLLYGIPAVHLRRLQSVLNAAARIVFNLRRYDHVTDGLICLHWLRVPERIQFKLAVLVYQSLHGMAPSYLSCFRSAASVSSRRQLRSNSGSNSVALQRLLVPRTRCVTFGARSFPVAGANIWNNLPLDITSAPSLSIFRRRLKTFLFNFSFPGLVV